MKVIYLAILSFFLTISQSIADYSVIPNVHNGITLNECSEFFPDNLGNIEDVQGRDLVTICRLNYAVIYDKDCKIPLITFESLLPSEIDGTTPRKDSFKSDPDLFKEDSSHVTDYVKSGFDRGHMVPANNMKENSVAMEQSFYLSNIIPQSPTVNRGVWKSLELYVHDVINKNDTNETFIITGVVVNNTPEKLGNNEVCIPSHTFKLLTTTDGNTETYLIPNNKEDASKIFKEHQVTWDVIEYLTRFKFIPAS